MRVTIATVILLTVVCHHRALADDQLLQVKQLYDAADYDAAILLIDGVSGAATGQLGALREYRALSLLALNRTPEAEREIGTLLEVDPLYAPAATAPPRWKSVVDRVRARVWPGIIRSHYGSAKQRFESRDFIAASTEFEALRTLLASARKEGLEGLDDLMTLTDGFLQLSRAELPSASAPPIVEAAPAVPIAEITPPPVVKPAVAIKRDFPAWNRPPGIPAWQIPAGRIAVMIGADGSVTSVRIIDSVHPTYDSVLTAAAKKWRFEPATTNGQPIASEVEVAVTLNSSPGR